MAGPNLQQTLDRAIQLHQSGKLAEAEACYRQVLSIDPNQTDVLERLGLLVHQQQRGDEAIKLLRRAAQVNSSSAEYHTNLGAALASQRRFEEAIESFRRATELRPDLVAAHINLANALKDSGRVEEAITAYRKAVSLAPPHAQAWHNLGSLLQNMGRSREAIEAYQKAIEIRPNWGEPCNNLASIYHARSELEEALKHYLRAAECSPTIAEIHNNLSTIYQETGRLNEGLKSAQLAVSLRQDYPEGHFNLGNALRNSGQSKAAIDEYRRAIALRSNYPQAWYNLGSALKDVGDLNGSIEAYRRAIRLRPEYGEAYANLANALRDAGELDESISKYRKAAELSDQTWVAGNLLYTLHFHPDFDAKRIYEEHVAWNKRFAKPRLSSIRPHTNDRSPDRRLRIAYVSCDFRHHPIGRFMLPLLTNHDHGQFHVCCYSDTLRHDRMSKELQSHADHWRVTLGVTDEKFAQLVHDDRIDILVDLSMHARTGRMMAFARKPAPVQVSYLAYCSTSGLETMDYRLSDPYLDPGGTDESVYFEKTVRLPRTYWCYPAPEIAPEVGPLPARNSGHITFGCLNVYAKVSRPAWLTWCRILKAVPDSRLIVHALEGSHRDRALDLVRTEGVDPARVEFVGFLPGTKYFEQYNQIDIAVDPFPYAGGTTTCDALWMGVPVVSLTGKTAVSRGGLSILSNLNLSDLVTDSTEHYVEVACKLAREVARLEELRRSLRERMRASPVMDAKQFASDIEAAYRLMWRSWCAP